MRFSFGLALSRCSGSPSSSIGSKASTPRWMVCNRWSCLLLRPVLRPVIFPHVRAVAHADNWGFRLHFMAAMLAYSLFTLSALHAVFMGYAERKLHQRALTKVWPACRRC